LLHVIGIFIAFATKLYCLACFGTIFVILCKQ